MFTDDGVEIGMKTQTKTYKRSRNDVVELVFPSSSLILDTNSK